MLRQKLINIKLILRIAISCLVLISMFKSCAKAYDESIFNLTKTQIDTNFDTLVEKNAIPQTMATYCKNSFSSVSSSYAGYFIMKTTSYYYFTWFYTGQGSAITNNSNDTHNTLYNMWKGCSSGLRFNLNGNYSSSGNFPYNSQTIDYCFSTIPINTRSLVMTERGEYGENYLIILNPLSYTNMFSEDYSYNGDTIEAVTTSYNNNSKIFESVAGYEGMSAIRFELYNGNTSITNTYNVVTQKNFNNGFTFNDLGEYGTLTISTRLINLNTIYNLKTIAIINGEEYEIEEKVIFFPSGTTIENGNITYMPSGDYSYNIQDSTNNIIDNQQQQTNEIVGAINNIVGSLPLEDASGDASGDSSGFSAGSGILGGIFNLFVPDANYFKSYFSDLNNWFSARLGLLYFPIEFTIEFLQRVLTIDFSTMQMSIGPYVLPFNDNYELVPEITIDFDEFLEDSLINAIHETYLLIVDGLIIFGLIRLISKKYNEVLKNRGGV